jgi:hypothetical protein
MANKSATVTMMAAMEEDAVFSSESVTDILIGQIAQSGTVGVAKRDEIVKSLDNAMLFGTSTPQPLTRDQNTAPRYKNLTTKYTVKKLPQAALVDGAEVNSIAIEITTRTYNTANPSWDTVPHVEHITQQEFNMGLVKVGGCAANYDIFAGHDFSQASFMGINSSKKVSYYAGHEWNSSVFMGFTSSSGSCADVPNTLSGSKEIQETSMMFFNRYCTNTSFGNNADCNATPLSFAGALYGSSDVNHDSTPDASQHTGLNINGTDGGPYANLADSTSPGNIPYPWTSLEKTIIDRISDSARSTTDHTAAKTAMMSDPHVSHIDNWYFRDVNGNNLPDIDTPYFYHDGDLTTALPANMRMLAFRNNYFYVDGKITSFSMMSAQGMNFGQLYLIATGDITKIEMASMTMASAGVVAMTNGHFSETAIMKMSGMNTTTLLANNSNPPPSPVPWGYVHENAITLNSGFDMSLMSRMHILSKDNITTGSMMTMGVLTGTGNHCGCTGSADESTEMQIGRRFSKS